MAKRVPRSPVLPTAMPVMGKAELGPLNRTLQQTFTEHSNRINQSIPADGSEPLDVPFPLALYTVATLPDPALWAGGSVIVTDGGPGGTPVVAYSDGVSWNYSGTGDGDMLGSNNLTDLANAATSFDNIKQVATDAYTGVVEHATDAELKAAATGNLVIKASQIESASAAVTLTYGSPTAIDWEGGFYRELTMTGDAELSNPTNGHPGTYRTIYVIGNNATPRALTFGSNFGGDPPILDDITSTVGYIVTIFCRSTSHFVVAAVDGSPP